MQRCCVEVEPFTAVRLYPFDGLPEQKVGGAQIVARFPGSADKIGGGLAVIGEQDARDGSAGLFGDNQAHACRGVGVAVHGPDQVCRRAAIAAEFHMLVMLRAELVAAGEGPAVSILVRWPDVFSSPG